MAKNTINVGSVPNDGTGDPLRTAMQYINTNFSEIYTALGPDGATVVNIVNANEELELLGTANKISFLYDTEAEVLALNTATHHGNLAHAHDTGALYYCHGEWRKVLTDTSAGAVTNYTDPVNLFSYNANIANLEAAGQVLSTNADGSYSWVTNAGGGGATNLPGLSDVTLSTPINGEVLKYNGSAWVNAADSTGGGTIVIQDEGSNLSATPSSINFVGAGVAATNSGNDITVTIGGGGGGSSTFADLTEVDNANIDVDDVAHQAVTRLVTGANGNTAYSFDQYPGDNPTIFVTAGQTIAFNLDGVPTHPFRILDGVGGAQYDTGLVHYASTGAATTGGAAQDKTGGTLYWKVPASISGDYAYVCTSHGAMEGIIRIANPAAGGGGSSAARNTEAKTTASITNGSSGSIAYTTIGKSYSLYKIESDGAAWVRIYSDTASRTADSGRTQGQDPAEGSGVIAEAVFSGAGTIRATPAVMGWLDNSESTVPVAVQNNTGSTGTVTVTLTALTLET